MSVRLFTTGTVQIKLSVLTIPVIAFCIIADMYMMLTIAFVSLTLHELCHVYMARRLCISVDSIDIQPCGFAAKMGDKDIPIKDEFAIASCGPAFSIVCGCICLSVIRLFEFQTELLFSFAIFNLTLGAVNLLPVIPLDGGRMLRALLSTHISPRKCHRLCCFIGLMISFAVCVCGAYCYMKGIVNFSLPVIGILMLLGTLSEFWHSDKIQLSAIMRRSNTLQSGKRLQVCYHAFSCTTDVKTVMSLLNANKYNIIDVIDNNMNVIATIDEGQLFDSVERGNLTLGEIAKEMQDRCPA